MFRYHPTTGTHEQFYQGEKVGGFTIQTDGSLLLFMERGTIRTWNKGQLTTWIEGIAEEHETRFNDVIADPAGRVFCGTMPTKDRLGRLYRLDTDAKLTKLLEGIGCSNGLGFSPDRRTLYYTDSPVRKIYAFDYCQLTGGISNQRVFVQTAPEDGYPDGLTVDGRGFVWSARWGGACVICYSPDGLEERRINLPARFITSLAFGGDSLSDIYITSALGEEDLDESAAAGALFSVNLGIRGIPEFFSGVHV